MAGATGGWSRHLPRTLRLIEFETKHESSQFANEVIELRSCRLHIIELSAASMLDSLMLCP